MNPENNFELIHQKLKSSPHWRDDFEIVETEDVGGIKVYRVSAKDQEPLTILAIAALNETLQG